MYRRRYNSIKMCISFRYCFGLTVVISKFEVRTIVTNQKSKLLFRLKLF